MIKIESVTLEEAYRGAALKLECSVTELNIEVVQSPSGGFLGLFKKSAIIVATKKITSSIDVHKEVIKEDKKEIREVVKQESKQTVKQESEQKQNKKRHKPKQTSKKSAHNVFNDTIMPETFVSTQDDEDYDMGDINFTADYDEDETPVVKEEVTGNTNAKEVAKSVEEEINILFDLTCFKIDKIEVSAYDETTLLIEFKGEDAALLIGKEGYRYKALSYMIFNWINTKYKLQLRLEIAEFLKNQEESVLRYLEGVCENINRDGKAQTKILDGVLVQIALRELREKYPNKYVAIRSTRDGLKFIIVNEYYN
ncbi:Jag N-terminal domain-containing protein [Candidatus Sulfurimonas marisnigri]|uniref:Jag N-terminal domain-containing protein n=1 Tax=Candidatus Sulfurimonas marisnigri TaxID=2740405 RepID=A0A7S7RQY8_9BACT|nr:Jag N-terminal domain-containing protein [Candidatus Sulfurimonas marisnigri]QOY55124.1 Jag N-terminal domain-containing protein [Candidatus Sulfurimonas marisnigri]